MSMRTERSDDVYYEQSALARELRETVADQLHDLVLEREALGSQDEIGERVRQVSRLLRRIVEARGRQRQAVEMGLAQGPAIHDEREARTLLRQTVMSLGEACGSWVVALDFEDRRQEVDG